MNNTDAVKETAFLLLLNQELLNRKIIYSKNYRDTIKAGKKYAGSINPGDVIGLKGELGSGKTQFVKGICEFFNVKEVVNSPTFLIVNEYKGLMPDNFKSVSIHHFDLYRIKFKEELETIGFNEYIDKFSICLIEWCEIISDYKDLNMKIVHFEHGNSKNDRIIKF